MKRELAVTGVALLISVLLSSPVFAQTKPQALNAAPAPAPVEAAVDAPEPVLSLDELVQGDVSPEDRAKLIMRCIGPPPRPFHSKQGDSQPVSEPAVIADAPSPLRN